ncbi:MAG TPA: histidine phosphatase family protein [Verrucomicrobiae bacterium]|nr:histidine phosphatase family protein [Verrucomicrobiae bacterium]
MKLYVARHGQTNYNDLGLCNADPSVDVHLTKDGIGQVEGLSERLKHIDIDQIFVSELKRTKQTAEILNKYHDAPVATDARLNDNRTGYEGLDYRKYLAALDSAENKWSVRLNDGESLEDVRVRIRSFLDSLKSKDFDAVLIVTSMFIVQAIYGVVHDLSYQEAWDLQVDKASCIELEL